MAVMMFKLMLLLVVMLSGVKLQCIDERHDTQLSVHLASLVEQVTRLVDEFQVRMNKLEELPAKIDRLEEKMSAQVNSSEKIEVRMKRLEEKVDVRMERLEEKMGMQEERDKSITCLCKCTKNSTSDWTVIQRRVSADVDFYRGWQDYKQGFGDPQGSFWLGLDKIHTLCSRNCELYVRMSKEKNQDSAYALYSTFSIADETDKYRLTVGKYNGTAGDTLARHNGMQFSTFDNDNDEMDSDNCAERFTGAFWFKKCHLANPNGHYFTGPPPHQYGKGITWYYYTTDYVSLKFIEMKVRPTS